MPDGYRADLLEKFKAAHPNTLTLGMAGFAFAAEAPDVRPESTPCPVCGVMLTEEHVADE